MISDRPVVLLTGASGVLGRPLVEELGDSVQLIALQHRTPIADPRVRVVPGADLRQPGLGLDRATWRSLGRQVTLVLHCAAETNWSLPRSEIRRRNVDATAHVLEFAAAADATFHHVSTAFVARPPAGSTLAEPGVGGVAAYVESKIDSEALVRSSGLRVVIARPSVITGDSRTGRIARYQGLHKVLGAIIRGTVPLVPADPGSLVDCLPDDLAAAAIGELVRRGTTSGEFWLTAGDQAPTVAEAVEAGLAAAVSAGLPRIVPRQLPVEAVDRLLLPMLDGLVDQRLRRSLATFVDLLMVFQSPTALPSSMAELGLAARCHRSLLVEALHRSAAAWAADQIRRGPGELEVA